MGCIYLITNTVSGKQYVGKTLATSDSRWKRHVREATRHQNNSILHRAIRLHGEESFRIDPVMQLTSNADLCHWEQFLIALFRTKAPYGYNLTNGGEGTQGLPTSEVTKDKLADALKARLNDPNSTMKNNFAGRKHSPETLEKMSKAQKGRTFSHESKVKLSISNKHNRWHTKLNVISPECPLCYGGTF